tara:strand:+ start:322 stop:501 length:180 start_codon:yes stop_codon:yes gene_type:complete
MKTNLKRNVLDYSLQNAKFQDGARKLIMPRTGPCKCPEEKTERKSHLSEAASVRTQSRE